MFAQFDCWWHHPIDLSWKFFIVYLNYVFAKCVNFTMIFAMTVTVDIAAVADIFPNQTAKQHGRKHF